MPKQRGTIFWCKVMNCQSIFELESDRDHHLQLHSEKESEKKKQKAKRYHRNEVSMNWHDTGVDTETQDERNLEPAAGMQTTTGDGIKQVPAQVESTSASVDTGVTPEGDHFVSILFD